jgi:16S rRNA processing protein RimM
MRPEVSERVAVAFVTRAKGVRGEVFAETLSHCPERFEELSRVVLQADGTPDRVMHIERWRPEGRGIILKFHGVDSPEEARAIATKRYVTIAPDEVAELPEGMHYISEVVGCRVESEEGEYLGRVADVWQGPSTDAYRVRNGDREFLVPAVEHFVVAMAVAENLIVVRGIEELLELQ